jgi:hypothetical protein
MTMEATSAQKPAMFGSLSTLMDEIDDWCGTKPHHGFPPRPHGIRDALISIAIHNLAGQISEPKVREQIQSQVANLYAVAGKNMAG